MFYIIIIAAGAFQPLLLLKGEKKMTTQTIFRTGRIPLLLFCDLYVLWIKTDNFAGHFKYPGKE